MSSIERISVNPASPRAFGEKFDFIFKTLKTFIDRFYLRGLNLRVRNVVPVGVVHKAGEFFNSRSHEVVLPSIEPVLMKRISIINDFYVKCKKCEASRDACNVAISKGIVAR